MKMVEITVTGANIDEVRASIVALDQKREVNIGNVISSWRVDILGIGSGCMTVWHDLDRAGLCIGGDSIYGDWDGPDRTLTTEDGIVYDDLGQEVST